MRVAVGSTNPVKRRAVQLAIESDADDFGDGADVEPVEVDSGVDEQPTGHAETCTGAEVRAERAYATGKYDLGVGIEGGVATFSGRDHVSRERIVGRDGRFLVMWAAVTDGDRVGVAAGPSIALPARIVDRIDAGEELGPVMDDVLGTSEIAKKQGAAGVFTGGRIDRAEALSQAVAGALGPFVCSLYE
ncbi:inosine/xanthosine triphosphatase [Halalkaliarchaeum desulfuricum]|uniref:inosine/xanthosine triphosphatase n=1 Tax=Halalkaliarchaeum desulfuricum TaxID=2055893 RepID=A0A343TH93_9EURY|nr:inosine/xanthosine triphosphatase [Halalkaliarchaeum desulfuricum]AUX08465.1 inosine/xanthosine triphosphatase [Halalkaliarchaeum desulfuricum]